MIGFKREEPPTKKFDRKKAVTQEASAVESKIPGVRQQHIALAFDEAPGSKTPPASAASATTGTGLNGRAHWKVKGVNRTYGEWQAQHTPAVEA